MKPLWIKIATMHLSGMPCRVSQMDIDGRCRSLLRIRDPRRHERRTPTATTRPESRAANPAIAPVTSLTVVGRSELQPRGDPLRFGASRSISAKSSGILAAVSFEISQIFPEARSSTRTRIMSTVVPPNVHTPARVWPGGSPGSSVPSGSSLNKAMLLLNLRCSARNSLARCVRFVFRPGVGCK
jgi:hypothetical protein